MISTTRRAITSIVYIPLLALALVCSIVACKPTPVPVADLEVCTKLEVPALEAKANELLAEALAHGWAAAEAMAERQIVTSGASIIGCAFAMIVDQYLAEHKAASPAQSWEAHDALEKLRAKLSAPGHSLTFRTSRGDL